MHPDQHLRVSDAERESATACLAEHFAACCSSTGPSSMTGPGGP